jgi:hypothetical protein
MKGIILMDEPPISRGFRSRRQEQTPKKPCTARTVCNDDLPVPSAGPTPQIKLENWNFAFHGASLLGKWNWAEFQALPQKTIRTNIHCVTFLDISSTIFVPVPIRIAGTYRQLFCLDGHHARPSMADSRRIGHCTPDGDAASPR